jgi:putative transposase
MASLHEGAIQYRNVSDAAKYVDLRINGILQWDGQAMRVIHVGDTLIGVLNERDEYTDIPVELFEDLVQAGRIKGVPTPNKPAIHPDALKQLVSASAADLNKANERSVFIQTYKTNKSSINEGPVSRRTVQRLLKQQREAEAIYGSGLVGLIPKMNRGNSMKKIPTQAQEELNKFISENYETLKQQTKFSVFSAYAESCKATGVHAVSYKTSTAQSTNALLMSRR